MSGKYDHLFSWPTEEESRPYVELGNLLGERKITREEFVRRRVALDGDEYRAGCAAAIILGEVRAGVQGEDY